MNKKFHLGDFTSQSNTGEPVPRYFGDALVSISKKQKNIVVLCADLSPATECDIFRDTFPDRFFMCGIAEANMIGLAAGMARTGDIPFVHSFSVFLSRRAFDQIAMQIAYPKTNVKLAGFIPGLTTLLGVSHQAIEDIALMRALPNMAIVEPSGPEQMAAAVKAVVNYNGPVYLRLHRAASKLPTHKSLRGLELGKAQLIKEGQHAIIFACGHMVDQSIIASQALLKKGIDISIANIHTLKPLDVDFILSHSKRTGHVVTAENHSIIGGLGSAIAETLLENNVAVNFSRVGIKDTFAEGASTSYLFDKYGLSAKHIENAVVANLS